MLINSALLANIFALLMNIFSPTADFCSPGSSVNLIY